MNSLKPVSKQYNQDMNWAFSHYTDLAKRYPNMWVACARKQIIATGKSIENKGDGGLSDNSHFPQFRRRRSFIFNNRFFENCNMNHKQFI